MLVLACGASQQQSSSAAGAEPLELTVTSDEGRTLTLSALRGRPVLLLLFATYDPTSQLAFTGLLRAIERDPRATVIGVAVQPDARTFLAPFRAALDVPFPLYFDADNALLQGRTRLGKIPGIPAFVALDAQGNVRKTLVGVASNAELTELIESTE